MTAVCIVSVFPELLGTYGDAGNVTVLERRLAWRGIPVEVVSVSAREPLPAGADLYVLGGGEDDNQLLALDLLRTSPLPQAVARGAHVFGVCAGLQLLGTTLSRADGSVVPGLGLLDLASTRLRRRVVGDVTAALPVELGLPPLTGFANHAGGSALGPQASPLGVTTASRGNTGRVGDPEGAVQGHVVATYLHGPVLARNPAVADWLLGRVVGQELDPLPAGPAELLHDMLERSGRRGRDHAHHGAAAQDEPGGVVAEVAGVQPAQE